MEWNGFRGQSSNMIITDCVCLIIAIIFHYITWRQFLGINFMKLHKLLGYSMSVCRLTYFSVALKCFFFFFFLARQWHNQDFYNFCPLCSLIMCHVSLTNTRKDKLHRVFSSFRPWCDTVISNAWKSKTLTAPAHGYENMSVMRRAPSTAL